ncbi:Sphingosine kinase 1 [Dimargaris cristalligena]|nr:Sphingosine kinase 1 [Dimargaris cristalligena]
MTNNHLLLHSGKVDFLSAGGLLHGLLSVATDSILFKDQTRSKSLLLSRSAAVSTQPIVTIPLYSVFGASLSPPQRSKFKSLADVLPFLDLKSSTHFTVFTLALNKGKKPQFEPWTFRCESRDQAQYWVDNIAAASRGARAGDTLPTRRICVLANPYGGNNKALQAYERIVKPMFALARIEPELRESSHADFAYEFGQSLDLKQYAAVVTLSGDGLLHQLINGIMSRLDWQDAIKSPIGIIPCGTCNGLAKSLDLNSVEAATLAAIKGRTHAADVMAVSRPDGSVIYGHLNMLWGLIADVDIESEKLRWAGSFRMNIWGVIRLLQLRKYQGRLHILPAPVAEDGQVEGATPIPAALHDVPPRFSLPEIHFDYEEAVAFNADMFTGPSASTRSPQSPTDLAAGPGSRARKSRRKHRGHTSPYLTLSGLTPQPSGDHAPDVVFPVAGKLPAPWETIEGPFVQVTAANVPWIASDMLISPHARLNDGAFDVVWLDDLPRTKLIQYLLDSETSATQLNGGHFHHRKVQAIILEPIGRKVSSAVPSRTSSVAHMAQSEATQSRDFSRSNRDLFTSFHRSADPMPILNHKPSVEFAAQLNGAQSDAPPSETNDTDGNAPAANPNSSTVGSKSGSKLSGYMKRATSMKVPTPQNWRSRFSVYQGGSSQNGSTSSTPTEVSSGTATPERSPGSQIRRFFGQGRNTRSLHLEDQQADHLVKVAASTQGQRVGLASVDNLTTTATVAARPTSPLASEGVPGSSSPTDQLEMPTLKAKNRLSVVLNSLQVDTAAELAALADDISPGPAPTETLSRRSVSTPSLRSPTHTTSPTSPTLAPLNGSVVGKISGVETNVLTYEQATSASGHHYHPGILDIDGEEVPCGPVKLESIRGLLNLIIPPWFSESTSDGEEI